MRPKPQPRLHFEIVQSQILRCFIHLIHSLLLVILTATEIKGFALCISLMLVLLSWVVSWYDHLRPFNLNPSLQLNISPSGRWALALQGDLKVKAYYSIPGLQVIRFEKTAIGASCLILLGDSADEASLRKLRVRLLETFEPAQSSDDGR